MRIADAIEARADEMVAAESENTGKALGVTAEEELPPSVDQIRFFAGAARMLEGKAAGKYMVELTSCVRREPADGTESASPCYHNNGLTCR